MKHLTVLSFLYSPSKSVKIVLGMNRPSKLSPFLLHQLRQPSDQPSLTMRRYRSKMVKANRSSEFRNSLSCRHCSTEEGPPKCLGMKDMIKRLRHEKRTLPHSILEKTIKDAMRIIK